MTKEIELAKQCGIQYRLSPEGTTEMWCIGRSVQAFAEAVQAEERERCAKLCDPANADDPSDWTDYAKTRAECAERIRKQ